jgi:microcystin degradation protein MlrC
VNRPRIAVLGFQIECNRFCPPATLHDFQIDAWRMGSDLAAAWSATPSLAPKEMQGFLQAMADTGGCTPVPIAYGCAAPNGPVEDAVFAAFQDALSQQLQAAGPLDGVYCAMHGAAATQSDDDPDGAVLALVRRIVGPQVPIVATFDLHANVSERTIGSLDVFVGYLTNPHIDMYERGVDAAIMLRRMLADEGRSGERLACAMARLPLLVPTIAMLTAPGGGAFADIVAAAAAACRKGQRHASVMGGFPHTDTSKNGITVVATAENRAAAQAIATEIAAAAWARRDDFARPLTSIADAVARAAAAGRDASLPRVILADLGDNPGGGAPATSGLLLQALLQADARDFTLGIVCDAALVAQARAALPGATIKAAFGPSGAPYRFSVSARVLNLSDGRFIGRRAGYTGRVVEMGPCCTLAIEGGTVVVSTWRHAPNDIGFFESQGVDLQRCRSIVLKSRGHFRASFDGLATDQNVIEVDTPGPTSPNLATFQWTHLPRPIHGLDADATWQPAHESGS